MAAKPRIRGGTSFLQGKNDAERYTELLAIKPKTQREKLQEIESLRFRMLQAVFSLLKQKWAV